MTRVPVPAENIALSYDHNTFKNSGIRSMKPYSVIMTELGKRCVTRTHAIPASLGPVKPGPPAVV